MEGKAYPNDRDCQHGRKRGSCELCDHEQDIAELSARVGNLLAIIDECRPKVLSAQMRAQEYADNSGEDHDYAVFLSELIVRMDEELSNR